MSAITTCREQWRSLQPTLERRLTSLSVAEEAWHASIAAFADEHGLSVGKDVISTIAAQAALLAVLKLAQDALLGGTIAADTSLSEAVQRADQRLRHDYAPSILDHLLEEVAEPVGFDPGDMALELRAAGLTDAIGETYEEVVPQAERRKLGQFWTPVHISNLMADWGIRSKADKVLEPASGSGRMMMSISARLRALGASDVQIGDQVYSNEISELVRVLMLTSLMAAVPGAAWKHTDLSDFMVTRDAESQRFDAIVCNPPYARHHLLPMFYKEQIKAIVKKENGLDVSGFASLFVHFYLHGAALLAKGGRAAYITPGELFDASYAQPIQNYILDELNLRAVIHFSDEMLAFEGVDTAGVISLTEAGPADDKPIAFVLVSRWPGNDVILQLIEQGFGADSVTTGAVQEYDWGTVEFRTRDELRKARKWLHNIETSDHSLAVPLSSVTRIMRGIATGANDYFTLTEAERVASGIDDKYLVPVLGKTRDAQGLTVTNADLARLRAAGRKAWLFAWFEDRGLFGDTPEGRYVDQGEERGIHKGSLVSKRSKWWQSEKRKTPPLIYTYMSRGNPRFVLNLAGVNTLNSFLHVVPKAEIADNPRTLAAFAAVLNSPFVLSQLKAVGRSYGGGTVKVEPRELDRLQVIDTSKLSAKAQKQLADIFLAAAKSDVSEAELGKVEAVLAQLHIATPKATQA